jgi:hypothetical protein
MACRRLGNQSASGVCGKDAPGSKGVDERRGGRSGFHPCLTLRLPVDREGGHRKTGRQTTRQRGEGGHNPSVCAGDASRRREPACGRPGHATHTEVPGSPWASAGGILGPSLGIGPSRVELKRPGGGLAVPGEGLGRRKKRSVPHGRPRDSPIVTARATRCAIRKASGNSDFRRTARTSDAASSVPIPAAAT